MLTEAEAAHLADRVRAYWRELGHDIEVKTVLVPAKGSEPAYWAIRTNLINGLPRKKQPPSSQKAVDIDASSGV